MISWEDRVHNLCGESSISFRAEFEPGDMPLANFFKAKPRSEFYMVEPHGDFVKFLGDPLPGRLSPDGELPVSVAGIEILERGNVYDRQGAD